MCVHEYRLFTSVCDCKCEFYCGHVRIRGGGGGGWVGGGGQGGYVWEWMPT